MGRQLNPRRAVVQDLRSIKATLQWLVSLWNVGSKVYITPKKSGDPWTRPRETDEYPENSADAWTALAEEMESVARRANSLARTARANAESLRIGDL